MTVPTPVTPIDAAGADIEDRLDGRTVEVPPSLLDRIAASGADVVTDDDARAEAGRDWWPLAIGWAAEGAVPQRPAAVVRPTSTAQVSAVLAACNEAGVPVTPAAGRSGVCGGSIPVHGGLALDMTACAGVDDVDEVSLRADVRAGTFGPDLEAALGKVGDGYTLGHWPQSMDLSTVGGWLACRGAGQYSTRYGKIEDMVVGLEVVLADGRIVHTEGAGPRAATGPNLTQLFVGSEGTLGVITQARLRIHPLPEAQERRAFGFTTFVAGLEACRRILRRGATPAVLRLYDQTESARNFERARHERPHRPRRNRSRPPGGHHGDRRRRVLGPGRRRATRPRAGTALARTPQRRVRTRPAVARGHRGRHRRGVGPVGRAPRPLRGRGRAPSRRSTEPWRPRPTSPTPTPTAHASTSRSGAAVPTATPGGASATTARRGTP